MGFKWDTAQGNLARIVGIGPARLTPSRGGNCSTTMIAPIPDMKPEITV